MILRKTRLFDSSFCRPFLSLIISIGVSQLLILNHTCNTCSLDSARSLNLACLLEVGQEAKCTICKFTNKVLIQKHLSSVGVFQPYFKSKEGISFTSLHCGVLTIFTIKIFSYESLKARKQKKYYQQATYEDKLQCFLNQVQCSSFKN